MSTLTLAITTIGDLLLNNKISRSGNKGDSIENIHLSIPEYQRPYKWTVRNSIQLLDDIIEAKNANKEVYRVGTLILHKDSHEVGQYNIVDGQQRTTTFALLLHALYKAINKEVCIDFLNQQVFDNQYSRRNIPNNHDAFERRFKQQSTEGRPDTHSWELENLKNFIEEKCELIVVITEDISEAFQFFDSQNARGKSLYPHDLLKAYHLREMSDIAQAEVEEIVKEWEKVSQAKLAEFFGDYLYRVKEWIGGNKATKLSEHNINKFKGITRNTNTPYAQFYKSAYAYANMVNNSAMPFVSGTRDVNGFQLNTPIIAGKPFFDYTKHYYTILKDIRDNSKYEGFYVKDNAIVKCLDKYFSYGTGNRITRLLFDTALLLYVDKFCPIDYPSASDTELFEQFLVFAFIWAYSLRAQYVHLGWLSAQNYILGRERDIKNSFNIYKLISESDNPITLLSSIADKLSPLSDSDIYQRAVKGGIGKKDDNSELGIYINYLSFFERNSFYKTNVSNGRTE